MKIYFNNKIINTSNVCFSYLDRGILYGDGIFENLRCYNGIPYALVQHWQRLQNSLDLLKIELSLNQKEIYDIIYSLLEQNKLTNKENCVVRIVVTRGKAIKRGLSFYYAKKPTIIITVDNYTPPPEHLYNEGIKIVSVQTPHHCLPVKTLSFLNNILAFNEALSKSAYEGIFADHNNEIIEGTITNIVFLKKGKLFLMDSPYALPGVTQQILKTIAEKNGYLVQKVKVKLNEIDLFDSCMLTNSLIEIMPVSQFNETVFKISDEVKKLRELYQLSIPDN